MNRKEQIIESVISKFKKDGFSTDLTITEIAKSVDIGKSTVYEYFKSKDDVIKEALLRMSDTNTDKIINIENIENMKFEEAFKVQLKVLFKIASESRMMFEVFSKDFQNQLPPAIQGELMIKMQEVKVLVEQRFILIMIKGVTEGLIKVDEDPLNINIISGLVIGSMLRFSDSDTNLDLQGFVDKVYEALLKVAN